MKRKREINYPGNKADPLCSTAKMVNSEIMANKVEKIWNIWVWHTEYNKTFATPYSIEITAFESTQTY